jgi:Rho-binding antiterminator
LRRDPFDLDFSFFDPNREGHMSHQVERCDFIDMLEESAKMHRTLAVTLRGDTHFADSVRDIVTESGEDFAIFRDHGRVPVSQILDCVWTSPREETYDGKL